ncbi:SbcC/MukB-like Walker B domain-containing protein [Listeria costaricensis]|uniref:SbcC/MukB-like Walker B domain-containing protein n=1 Tax=Listeria costaricensis TaxID=2026604 RepID=UPI000C07B044|nr:SMC family ATPase [Listeria costaricensis]
MRPLQLTMQAFGAYAGTEVIDFEQLGDERMFVITGKTGAGKSTIFDAISFAIFGRANTYDRESFSMRSDFADPQEITRVSLSFELRGKTYLIERTPTQDVQKQRGDGMRTLNQKATLYERTGGEEKLLASSVRDVTTKMEEILQLDVHQFRQILMIPQGEFRELLVSESKEKEAILQRLAHTQFYQKMEEAFLEKQKQAYQQVAQAEQEKALILAQLFQDDVPEALTAAEERALIEKQLEEKRAAKHEADQNLQVVEQEIEQTLQKIAVAKQLLADLAEKEQAEKQLENLEAQQAKFQEQAARINRIQLAERLKPLYEQQIQSGKAKVEAEKAKLEMERQLARATETERLSHQELAELEEKRPQYEKWRRNSIQFDEIAHKISRLQTIESELHKVSRQVEQLEKRYTELEQQKERTEQEISLKETLLNDTNDLDRRYYHLEKQLDDLTRLAEDYAAEIAREKSLQEWQKMLQQKTQVWEQVSARKKAIETKLVAIRAAEQQELAAMLAATLVEGEACPVCGSAHHPQKAVHQETMHSDEQQQAEKELAQINEELAVLEKERQHFIWQIEQAERENGETLQSYEIHYQAVIGQKNELAKEKSFLKEQLVQRQQNQQDKLALEQKAAEYQAQLLQLAPDRTHNKEQLTKLLHEQTLLQEAIPEPLRVPETFYATQKRISANMAHFEKQETSAKAAAEDAKIAMVQAGSLLKGLEGQFFQAEQAANTAATVFQTALDEKGFQDAADYLAYLEGVGELTTLLAELERYQHDCLLTKEKVAALRQKVDQKEQPDLTRLEQHFSEQKEARTELAERRAGIIEMIRQQEQLADRLDALLVRLAKYEAEYANIGFLADMARGKNDRKLTFERYVLATFLDTIVQRANVRLAKMTGGRFLLRRKKERAKGNVQSGLELEVFDEYTGQTRHVKTLSGGESFKTSLALALALAEVVQEMAGGISLETMFIDEGFGTLDPESLEMAIECLLETQESGRLVGIISHVPELKERIPAKLVVTASNRGSTTQFILQN